MGAVRDLAERLLSGETDTSRMHPLLTFLGLEAYGPRVAFVSSLANVVAVRTDEGLVLVDTGSFLTGESIRASLRAWCEQPVRMAVYTHGHVDHVLGIAAFEREAAAAGWPRIEVIAHEAVVARFERYRRTAGLNARINARQFGVPGLGWPTEYRAPDRCYRDRLDIEVGGVRFELRHARGETDDHSWVYVPGEKLLCTGDLFIWAVPNCGNPQKVQRYAGEWAAALREMATLDVELLCPGHGPPIEGAGRIREALLETARLLAFLHDETVRRMNEGMALEDIVAEVRPPPEWLERPWLRPVYDDPEFIVRNVWRQYAGWWDGDPARLKPPRGAELAAEVAALAGGPQVLAERARRLAAEGRLELATQLVEWAARAAPDDASVGELRASIYRERARAEPSLMARNIFLDAARRAPSGS